MCIGFASISTTLIINGSVKVGENTNEFSVIFTEVSLDGTDVYASVIDDTKKIITFETNDLKTLNQTSVLTYEVTNNSSNYDAEVQVNCKVKDEATAKYTSIKNELEENATKVVAKETLKGTLTVTLNKTSTEEVREEYVCELTFNAIERDTLGGYNGPTEWTFDYIGEEQTFIAPLSGTYKLETWGAQGGSYDNILLGGYGGYSEGIVSLQKNQNLYINVGENGKNCVGANCTLNSSYNGGGQCKAYTISTSSCSTGGGATHIAQASGLLTTLENKVNDILIVSGGGGGGTYTNGSNNGAGGHAGGYSGTDATNPNNSSDFIGNGYGLGANQNKPGYKYNSKDNSEYCLGKFGLGGYCSSPYTTYAASGGSGFYGGGGSAYTGGGGGSGYIGNSLLTDKSMYCYNCDESTEESTKTISTTCVSETPTENCAKIGNGYAKITLIK